MRVKRDHGDGNGNGSSRNSKPEFERKRKPVDELASKPRWNELSRFRSNSKLDEPGFYGSREDLSIVNVIGCRPLVVKGSLRLGDDVYSASWI